MKKDALGPYSIIRLHHHDERRWGVTDARGALVELDGLSMKMTKNEAQTLADRWNAAGDDEVRQENAVESE